MFCFSSWFWFCIFYFGFVALCFLFWFCGYCCFFDVFLYFLVFLNVFEVLVFWWLFIFGDYLFPAVLQQISGLWQTNGIFGASYEILGFFYCRVDEPCFRNQALFLERPDGPS